MKTDILAHLHPHGVKNEKDKTTFGEWIVNDSKRKTRKQYSAEEKISIVLDGLRSEESIIELCRQEVITQGLYHK